MIVKDIESQEDSNETYQENVLIFGISTSILFLLALYL
jgi:hypothetical protein